MPLRARCSRRRPRWRATCRRVARAAAILWPPYGANERVDPIEDLREDRILLPAGDLHAHLEGVIAVGDFEELRLRIEPRQQRADLIGRAELVAAALDEQHRQRDGRQV